jgi:CRP-like cAMP-binding protein
MQPEERSGRREAVAAHPLVELLDCPTETSILLKQSVRAIEVQAGEVIFQQSGPCLGLYVVISGDFIRKAERCEAHLTLGAARPGDLVELAAALGNGCHTYTLAALTVGSVLLLPIEALNQAFQSYTKLRMQLLEELAREVSRAYETCWMQRGMRRTTAPA